MIVRRKRLSTVPQTLSQTYTRFDIYGLSLDICRRNYNWTTKLYATIIINYLCRNWVKEVKEFTICFFLSLAYLQQPIILFIVSPLNLHAFELTIYHSLRRVNSTNSRVTRRETKIQLISYREMIIQINLNIIHERYQRLRFHLLYPRDE